MRCVLFNFLLNSLCCVCSFKCRDFVNKTNGMASQQFHPPTTSVATNEFDIKLRTLHPRPSIHFVYGEEDFHAVYTAIEAQ